MSESIRRIENLNQRFGVRERESICKMKKTTTERNAIHFYTYIYPTIINESLTPFARKMVERERALRLRFSQRSPYQIIYFMKFRNELLFVDSLVGSSEFTRCRLHMEAIETKRERQRRRERVREQTRKEQTARRRAIYTCCALKFNQLNQLYGSAVHVKFAFHLFLPFLVFRIYLPSVIQSSGCARARSFLQFFVFFFLFNFHSVYLCALIPIRECVCVDILNGVPF